MDTEIVKALNEIANALNGIARNLLFIELVLATISGILFAMRW